MGNEAGSNIGNVANEMGNYILPIKFGSGAAIPVVKIGTGWYHSGAIMSDFKLKCFGRNGQGQLGYGDTTHRGNNANQMGNYLDFVNLGSGRTAVDVMGSHHSMCAILDNFGIKCWGDNQV